MDTSETGLEKIIVDWLVQHNGYEQETPHAFNKDFALVDKWVERFVTETKPEKVKQSMCFASDICIFAVKMIESFTCQTMRNEINAVLLRKEF